jgi:hypothetical protein
LLGCPVEWAAPEAVAEIRVGEVKALVVPADRPLELEFVAVGKGAFSLQVLTPYSLESHRFAPRAIEPGDRFRVVLDRGAVSLRGRLGGVS